jgi:tight adherence protein C
MSTLLLLALGAAVAGAMLALMAGLRSRWETQATEEERYQSVRAIPTLEEVEMSRPFSERVLGPGFARLLGLLSRLAPQHNIQELQRKLEIAGRPHGWTAMDVIGLRVLSAMLSTVMFFLLLGLSDLSFAARLLFTAASGLLGFYLPIAWLGWRMNQRRQAIQRALPDGLDMLNVCVGAGLGFDMALSRVGERWQGPLADEFNRVLAEMRLGKTRRQALLDLAARTDVTEVEIFVAALVQADQLGVSIAKVLRTQAEQMRIVRRQRAEELARQASIKMLFPLVFLIFPALLAVLLGPAIPKILNTFTNLGR